MLWNWIAYHARQRPRATAVILSGQAVTYAKFASDVARATEDLRARLPISATLVGVGVRQSYLHWVAILALARLGVPSVSVMDSASLAVGRPDVLIADEQMGTGEAVLIEPAATWSQGGADAAVLAVRDPRRDVAMRMVVSSGTTGAPKRVMLSAARVEQRLLQACECYGVGAHSRTNVQMGEGTIGGFSIPLMTWMAGGAVVLAIEPMFNDRVPPAAKPDFVMLSAANLTALLAKTTDDTELFPGTRILIGGSAVPQPLMERARRRLSRLTGVVYGSTEAGTIAIDMEEREAFIPQAVGYPAPWVELQLVDDDDTPVEPLKQGHIRFRSPSLVDGYVDDPQTTAVHFRDGWFYPGDLGMMSAQGLLVITGRSDETFNFGGQKIAAITLEEAALAVPGVADAAACALRDDAGELAIVAVKAAERYDRDALALALKACGQFRIAIAEIAEVPRNAMGKIERQILVQMILAQRATMN